MINFRKINNKVILSYSSDYPSPVWVYRELDKSGSITISKAFTFTKKELFSAVDEENEESPVEFEAAFKAGEYYRFPKEILSLEHDLYVHEDAKLERKLFVAVRGISIFPKIDDMVDGSIYLGGDEEDAIPMSVYYDLLGSFVFKLKALG